MASGPAQDIPTMRIVNPHDSGESICINRENFNPKKMTEWSDEGPSLSTLSIPELRDVAKKREIDVSGLKKKVDLITALGEEVAEE